MYRYAYGDSRSLEVNQNAGQSGEKSALPNAEFMRSALDRQAFLYRHTLERKLLRVVVVLIIR